MLYDSCPGFIIEWSISKEGICVQNAFEVAGSRVPHVLFRIANFHKITTRSIKPIHNCKRRHRWFELPVCSMTKFYFQGTGWSLGDGLDPRQRKIYSNRFKQQITIRILEEMGHVPHVRKENYQSVLYFTCQNTCTMNLQLLYLQNKLL